MASRIACRFVPLPGTSTRIDRPARSVHTSGKGIGSKLPLGIEGEKLYLRRLAEHSGAWMISAVHGREEDAVS